MIDSGYFSGAFKEQLAACDGKAIVTLHLRDGGMLDLSAIQRLEGGYLVAIGVNAAARNMPRHEAPSTLTYPLLAISYDAISFVRVTAAQESVFRMQS